MAQLFTDILARGVRQGQIPARTDSARNWYRETARTYRRIDEDQFMRQDRDRMVNQPLLGEMYMFQYSPKHKATLPYYDRLPLIFPFRKVKGGFYGINLHYLPLQLRAKLMDELYSIASDDRYDDTTRLKLNYTTLQAVSRNQYFKPCIKHYLTKQMNTRFMKIYSAEWDMALFLPLERFVGANKSQVWAESRRKLR